MTADSRGRASGGETAAAHDLGPRDREILRDVIRSYVVTGEPVSSRAIAKQRSDHLSAATIRNVMADLEELGLLVQPHTSAGRIPTQAAYRIYVESLMGHRHLPVRERRYIERYLAEAVSDADRLMGAASRLLSELSHQVGVVLLPPVEEGVLRAIDFVPVGSGRVLCVVVSSGGFVDNVLIDVDEPADRDELQRMSRYVTETFAGRRLREVRDELLRLMSEERARVDLWLGRAMELARRAVEAAQDQGLLVEGTTSLLDRPELASIERIRRMLDTFADKARLVTMLSRCLASDRVRVFIGDDTEVTSELDFSLVATSYGVGTDTRGSLGIIGPSRMEYPRVVPLVRFLGEALSGALADSARE